MAACLGSEGRGLIRWRGILTGILTRARGVRLGFSCFRGSSEFRSIGYLHAATVIGIGFLHWEGSSVFSGDEVVTGEEGELACPLSLSSESEEEVVVESSEEDETRALWSRPC